MKEEQEIYLKIANRNHLNEDGYKRLVKLLNGEIKDFSTKRTSLLIETPKDIERLNKRRTRIALK